MAVFPVSRALYAFTDRLLSACSLALKLLLVFGFSTQCSTLSLKPVLTFPAWKHYLDSEWLKAMNTQCLTVSESDESWCVPPDCLALVRF